MAAGQAGSFSNQRRNDLMQFLVHVHKISRWFLVRRLKIPSRIIDGLIRLAFAARIPAEARIDPTVKFSHNGLAVVITKEAEIGPRCMIGMHVVLGSRWPIRGAPIIEEDVMIHAGAKVIGPIRIGRGSVIGANAVVLNDIPPLSLAVGVPAVIKKSGIAIDDYKIEAQAASAA
jgi:serine O-acetyltransferase